MKRSFRKRSKPKIRIMLTLAVVFLLLSSALGAIYFIRQPSRNSGRAGYVIGDPIDNGLTTGMTILLIRNSNEKVSIRFTAKFSGSVTELTISAMTISGGNSTARIGLQNDESGNPDGKWIGQTGYGNAQIHSRSRFATAKLEHPVTITKGNIYHVVVEAAPDVASSEIWVLAYQVNAHAQPLNDQDPDITWPDTNMNMLSYNGTTWKEKETWPVFVIKYFDDTSEGQPYSLSAQGLVYSSNYVGQTITPASTYTIGNLAFLVGLQGTPKDSLYYQIRGENNKILANGHFADASQLTSIRQWITINLTAPVTLEAGQPYRLILLSPDTDQANPYYLFRHESCYDPTIGYGGQQDQFTSSQDGGSTWSDNPDADAIFKITTTG